MRNIVKENIKDADNFNSIDKDELIQKATTVEELIKNAPKNQTIVDNLLRAWTIITNSKYKKILCSISGGSDSDIMLDIVWRCDNQNKVEYVWFDTGLEYRATKEHLEYLEDKYGISIEKYKASKPIPICCKQYGQPFLSKQISEFIYRLQKHGFQWEDEPYDALINKYSNCKAALRWWCNVWGENSRFNIGYHKHLKEFMILNPPNFLISNKCCHYAKKLVASKVKEEHQCDLNIVGVRKAEGGARSSAYKNCFTNNDTKVDEYRPLFWYKESDKKDYSLKYGIQHSDCYTNYGLKRTGCAGCPYGRNFENELLVIKKYEPKLFAAVNSIFGDSYTYTRKYREFCKQRNG